jgi:hypothetical protein
MNKCIVCKRPLQQGLNGMCMSCKTKGGNWVGKIGTGLMALATIVIPIILKRRKK